MAESTARSERIAVTVALVLALLATYWISYRPGPDHGDHSLPPSLAEAGEAGFGIHRFHFAEVAFSPLNFRYAWHVVAPQAPYTLASDAVRIRLAPSGDARSWAVAASLPAQLFSLAVTLQAHLDDSSMPVCFAIGLLDSTQAVAASAVQYGGVWCTAFAAADDIVAVQYRDATGASQRRTAIGRGQAKAKAVTLTTMFTKNPGSVRIHVEPSGLAATAPVLDWRSVDRLFVHVAVAEFLMHGRKFDGAEVQIQALQTSMFDRFYVSLPIARYGGEAFAHPFGVYAYGSWLIQDGEQLTMTHDALPIPPQTPVHVVLFHSRLGTHMAVTILAEDTVRAGFDEFAATESGEIVAFLPNVFVPNAIGDYVATATATALFGPLAAVRDD